MESIFPSNEMLGLNIICDNDSGTYGSSSSAAAAKAIEKIRRKPKKNNKYEKRRAKAQKAKLLKERNTKGHAHTITSPKGNKNDLDVNGIINIRKTDVDISSALSVPISPSNVTSSENNNSEEDVKTNLSSYQKENENNYSTSPISIPRTTTSINTKTQFDPSSSSNTTASRKNQHSRTEQLLKDEVKRAEYMQTYHARPSEMDRRNNAVSKIQQSSESTHIFMDDGDDDHNGDNVHNCPFTNCGLHPNIVRAITSSKGNALNLKRPTMIQRNAWEQILIKKDNNHQQNFELRNKNLFIQSETGSGKTLAYLLPIIQQLAVDMKTFEFKKVDRQLGGTRAIILCPTRELATQTATIAEKVCQNSFSWLVAGCLSGGEKRKSEKARLRKGISILIATPGRLLDHLSKTDSLLMALKGKLEWVVLDESDRLLDLGLGSQVEQIMQTIRANQPKSGLKRDGITWQSVLVSATINEKVEQMSSTLLGGNDWVWARFKKDKMKKFNTNVDTNDCVAINKTVELSNATPKQLIQHHMVVSSKLRLTALISFMISRIQKKERLVVFMSTCDGVDFHHKLFNQMLPITQTEKEDINDIKASKGIFGNYCSFYRLHGNIPHQERNKIMSQFSEIDEDNKKAAVMITTDVAARGLNLPAVDWIIQYDPPCETNDYIHRAGRAARAGNAGHALLFLLPSEIQYAEVLRLKGLSTLTALSLATTLQSAAKICPDITLEGLEKAGNGNRSNINANIMGEAFSAAVQQRVEDCIIEDDKLYKETLSKKASNHGNDKALKRKQRREAKHAIGPLLEAAANAFFAYIRGYSTKEKCVRHIFSARALHLGHVAKSFALREQPKELLKNHRYNNRGSNQQGSQGEVGEELKSTGRKRSSQLAFGNGKGVKTNTDGEQEHSKQIHQAVDVVETKRKRKGERNSFGGDSKFKPQKSLEDIKATMFAAASRIQGGDMEFF